MKAVTVHAALLAIALVAAFVTWTADDAEDTADTMVQVWDRDVADLIAVIYESDERTIEIERRDGDGDSGYVWATETVPDPVTVAATAADSAAIESSVDTTAAADSAATEADTTIDNVSADSAVAAAGDTVTAPAVQVEEYPVGESGTMLMEDLAQLRALRDLGEVDDEKHDAYGLSDVGATVTLRFRDGAERVLTVGQPVASAGHRYALDSQTERVYVLPGSLLRPLELGGNMLRLTQIQPFQPDDVASVSVRADQVERTMERRTVGSPPQPTWTPPGSSTPDQTFANFMDQLDRLFVQRYVAGITTDTLQPILRADYLDERGDTLGTLELFRTRSADAPIYYLQTETTIVPGEVYAPLAERIEQDVETLFGGAASRRQKAASSTNE